MAKIPGTENAMNLDKIDNGTVRDMFDSLNENFTTIGKPQAIDTVSIKNGAVTTEKINDGAITTGKINDGAVTENKIDDGVVTSDKIGSEAVTLTKISNDLKNWFLDKAHPVGSFYWSANNTNPGNSDVLGIGTWTQIKDTFILAAGDTYAAGTSGGEAWHLLTTSEMPSHAHYTLTWDATQIGLGYTSYSSANKRCLTVDADAIPGGTINPYTGSNGGSQPHNNMPPYITAYCWRRTA